MREDLQRLTTLMRNLAEFGHPSAPVLAFGLVSDAITDALHRVGPSAEHKAIRLACEPGDARVTAFFDRGRFALALTNLLEHAIRRSPRSSSVEVRLARGAGEEGLVSIRIEDHGPALGPEHLERIFEPFFAPNRAARGLDLALAKRIVEQHGGTVHASSSGASGVRFTCVMPGSGP
jgi:signal transduction histidine kinase